MELWIWLSIALVRLYLVKEGNGVEVRPTHNLKKSAFIIHCSSLYLITIVPKEGFGMKSRPIHSKTISFHMPLSIYILLWRGLGWGHGYQTIKQSAFICPCPSVYKDNMQWFKMATFLGISCLKVSMDILDVYFRKLLFDLYVESIYMTTSWSLIGEVWFCKTG